MMNHYQISKATYIVSTVPIPLTLPRVLSSTVSSLGMVLADTSPRAWSVPWLASGSTCKCQHSVSRVAPPHAGISPSLVQVHFYFLHEVCRTYLLTSHSVVSGSKLRILVWDHEGLGHKVEVFGTLGNLKTFYILVHPEPEVKRAMFHHPTCPFLWARNS